MSDLKPVTIEFDGREYVVEKEDSIWGLIEAIEGVITFFELAKAFQRESYPTAKIFRAYATAIQYAGGNVTANELRSKSNYDDLGQYAGALAAILGMAQPGADVDLGDTEEAGKEAKKKAPTRKRSTAKTKG